MADAGIYFLRLIKTNFAASTEIKDKTWKFTAPPAAQHSFFIAYNCITCVTESSPYLRTGHTEVVNGRFNSSATVRGASRCRHKRFQIIVEELPPREERGSVTEFNALCDLEGMFIKGSSLYSRYAH